MCVAFTVCLAAKGIESCRNAHEKIPAYIEPLRGDTKGMTVPYRKRCSDDFEEYSAHTVLPIAAAANGLAP